MEFNSSITSLSEEQLNSIFEDFSSDSGEKSTATAEDLKIGKEDTSLLPSLEDTDLDKLIDAENEEDSDEKKDDPEENKEVKKVEGNQSDVLKNTAKFLIEKGEWKDVEGLEEIEFTDEVYADLAQKQAQEKVDEMFNELLDSTGDYGKAIITHIKNGGNPDTIIDIFKEQKALENFDITEDLNQKSLIEKYYTEVVGWSKSKTDRYINSLEGEENALEEESKEVKSKFQEIFSERLRKIQEEEQNIKKQKDLQQQEYINNLSKEIDSYEEFTDSDKKLVKNSLLKFNRQLSDGTKVSDFFIKFQEIQKNPKEYIKLVHFIMDREGFESKLRVKEEKKAVEKTWNFVKGNNSVNTKSNNNPETTNKHSKISFQFKK